MRWFRKEGELSAEDRAIAEEFDLPLEILRELKSVGENLRELEGNDGDERSCDSKIAMSSRDTEP